LEQRLKEWPFRACPTWYVYGMQPIYIYTATKPDNIANANKCMLTGGECQGIDVGRGGGLGRGYRIQCL